MRSTHTYAILEVSSSAYQEIRIALEKAGYSDQFHDKQVSGEDAEVIDMHGVALMSKNDFEADPLLGGEVNCDHNAMRDLIDKYPN